MDSLAFEFFIPVEFLNTGPIEATRVAALIAHAVASSRVAAACAESVVEDACIRGHHLRHWGHPRLGYPRCCWGSNDTYLDG
jgi:hypothetical protein